LGSGLVQFDLKCPTGKRTAFNALPVDIPQSKANSDLLNCADWISVFLALRYYSRLAGKGVRSLRSWLLNHCRHCRVTS